MLHSTKSTTFSYKYYFFIIDEVAFWARRNGVMGCIWLAGCSLETPDITRVKKTTLFHYK